jgi:hypothetical protein
MIYDCYYDDCSHYTTYNAGTDTIRFGAGIDQTNLLLTLIGTDLEITFTNYPEDKITVWNWVHSNSRIEKIEFANGAIVNVDGML